MTARDITKAHFKVMLSRTDWVLMPTTEQDAILRRIERSCYNEAINRAKVANVNRVFTDQSFAGIYADVVYKVGTHLDPESDVNRHYEVPDSFIKRVLGGEIDAESVATCTYEEMRPEVNQKIRDDIYAKMNVKEDKKVSHEYQCKNCGCNETTYVIGQIRGADENTTKFVRCENCYLQWKING